MRLVTFVYDDEEHAGVLKGDRVIDITQWMALTNGALSRSIIDGMVDDGNSEREWAARYRDRTALLRDLFRKSSVGRAVAEEARRLMLVELGQDVDLDALDPDFFDELEFPDPFNMLALIGTGLDLGATLLVEDEEALRADDLLIDLSDVELLSPVPRPPKHVLCLGRNYAEHAAESTRAFGEAAATDKPAFPAIFTKAPTAINGPFGDIPYDAAVSTQIDWEGELAIVIGMGGKNISRENAMQHIFGYTILNDISARDIQKRHGGQFFKGKSLDGSCPIGPWIVTADEIGEPGNLELTVRVNGEVKQQDNTSSMLFTIPEIVEHLSLGMTLEPGDIIATGTPAGVGHARTPPEFLRPGDLVEVEIEQIGTISNRIAEA